MSWKMLKLAGLLIGAWLIGWMFRPPEEDAGEVSIGYDDDDLGEDVDDDEA